MLTKRVLRFFFFILFFISPFRLDGQQPAVVFQTIGKLEDYSFIQSTRLYQDPTGILWITTYRGTNSWDGTKITAYPAVPFDTTQVLGTVWCGDDQQNLWASGNNGLQRYDLKEEKIYRVPLALEGSKLQWTGLLHYSGGCLWMGSDRGIVKYYPEQDRLEPVTVRDEKGSPLTEIFAHEFIDDAAGNTWMFTRKALFAYEKKSGAFVKQPIVLPDYIHEELVLAEMSLDPEGYFWLFGARSELARFNPMDRTFEWHQVPVYESISYTVHGGLTVDRQGKIWFGIDRGVFRYDPLTGLLKQMNHPDDGYLVMDMLTDRQGNILIATLNRGVVLVDVRQAEYGFLGLKDVLKKGGVSWMTATARDEENIWVGTFGRGLIRYHMQSEKFQVYRADGNPGSLSMNIVSEILTDRKGGTWIMLKNGMFYKYDPQFDQFDLHPITGNCVITKDQDHFWLLEKDRLIRFDPLSFDTTNFYFDRPLSIKRPISVLLDLIPFIKDKDGIFWFGQQDGGLYRIEPKKGSWTHYNYEKNNPESLPYRHIQSLFCDSRGQVWVANYVGLCRIIPDHVSDTAIKFDNRYCIDHRINTPVRITEDIYGNILVGTINGMHLIRPDGSYGFLDSKTGLPQKSDWVWSLERDEKSREIYYGNRNLYILPGDFQKKDTYVPPIILTGLHINGKKISPGTHSPLKASIQLADHIQLGHDENFMRIDFSALSFSYSEENKFRYYLEGIDLDTVDCGTRTFAEYTDLRPGKYTFWVSGASYNGPFNPKGRSISITLQPPWYKSQLAFLFYLLGLLALITGIIRLRTTRLNQERIRLESEVENRTREIQEKNQQIVELDALKTRFFNNISHEFRTLVTMVKAPAETIMEEEKISRKGQKGLEVIYRNTQGLMKLVNQLLDISRLDKHRLKLSLQQGNIFDFAHGVAVSFAALAEAKGIQYLYYLPRTDSLEWFDPDKLEKVLNNLLSNAFKFTEEGGRVRMDMVHKNQSNGIDNILEIIVSDSGMGIPEEEQEKIFDRFYQAEAHLRKEGGGTGIGLSLTHDLVKLMHGTIKLESQVGKGSSFIIQIPLGLDHLSEDEYSLVEEILGKPEAEIPLLLDAPEERSGTEAPDVKDQRPLLLIVEDNPDILWLLARKLGHHFRVLEAVDGSAGWKLATEKMPDLIITDLMMPRMDGTELCQNLKNEVRTSHIPVIMLTAKASGEDKMAGLETGADDYITKPFEVKEVIARSKNLVEQRRKLREKFSREITLNPREIVVTSTDEKFLNQAMEVIDRHMSNEHFDVAELCKEMHMSRSTLFRKLDALTNQSPVEFIRTLRLKRAAILLKERYGNVSEVALEVGFSNPSYFAKTFKKAFSVSPSQFAKLQPI